MLLLFLHGKHPGVGGKEQLVLLVYVEDHEGVELNRLLAKDFDELGPAAAVSGAEFAQGLLQPGGVLTMAVMIELICFANEGVLGLECREESDIFAVLVHLQNLLESGEPIRELGGAVLIIFVERSGLF